MAPDEVTEDPRCPIVRRLLFLAGLLVALASPSTAGAATPLYPDLKTLPPRDLKLERTDQETPGSAHNVLRFSSTAWNVGRGALAIRGDIDPATKSGPAYQRIYNEDGSFSEHPVGGFYWHAQHSH